MRQPSGHSALRSSRARSHHATSAQRTVAPGARVAMASEVAVADGVTAAEGGSAHAANKRKKSDAAPPVKKTNTVRLRAKRGGGGWRPIRS